MHRVRPMYTSDIENR